MAVTQVETMVAPTQVEAGEAMRRGQILDIIRRQIKVARYTRGCPVKIYFR